MTSPVRVDLWKSIWLLFIPILWWGSSAASGWLSPSFESPSFEFIEFAVHSARNADYGMDPFAVAMAPIDPSIIDEALADQGNSALLVPPYIGPNPASNGEGQEDSDDRDDRRQDAPGPAPTPEPTTDPGSNGNGNGGGGSGNGNGGGNGNAGGNGNGGNGNAGTNDKVKKNP